MGNYHLAQFNAARMRGPLDSDIMAGFVARLEEINAVADAAPGFVWRLRTEDGDATAIRPYDDEFILVNLSVWESPEALRDYVYRSRHREVLQQRRDWFEPLEDATLVLWWVPVGHLPPVAEAVSRLERLRRDGPTPDAFTFRELFSPPDTAPEPRPNAIDDACPAT